jgi:hypothetical protein
MAGVVAAQNAPKATYGGVITQPAVAAQQFTGSGMKNAPQPTPAYTPKPAAIASAPLATTGKLPDKLTQINAAAPVPSASTNPYSLVDAGGYISPTKGAVGAGGYGFNSGLGGDSAAQLAFKKSPSNAGLWAAGYDPSDPNLNYKLHEYMKANSLSKSDLEGFYKNNPNGTFANAMDWYFHDLGGRMGKSNGFLDSTLGKVLSTAGQIGLGFIPGVGPALAAGLGAITGGLQGGIGGAILGGLGGYGSGSLGASLATNGIGGTINNAVSGFTNLFGGGATTNAAALGSGASLTSGLSNAANIGGVGGGLASGISALTPNLASLGGASTLAAGLGGGGSLLSGIGALTPALASLGGATALSSALGNGAVNAAGGGGFGVSDIPTPSPSSLNNSNSTQPIINTTAAGATATNQPMVNAVTSANGAATGGNGTAAGGGFVNEAALGGATAGTGGLLGAGGIGGANGLGTAGIGALTPDLASLGGAAALTGALGTGAAALGSGAGITAALGGLPASLAGGAASGGSLISSILGSLGGTGGLSAGAGTLLQGILGQLGQSDLESLANRVGAQNNAFAAYMPPMSYRDSILSNLNTIMNNPNQIMQQKPYSDYMDYAQRSVERKMVSQGYGGVGQSTNTADAVTRATNESMAGILQMDRQIATQQLSPFFQAATAGLNGNNSTIDLQAAPSAAQAGNISNIVGGAASILNNTGILQNLF